MSKVLAVSSLSSHIQHNGTVSWSEASHPLMALVDSGADNNFIDSDFVFQSHLPSEPLPQPKDVFTLNGKVLACVTHRAAPISQLLSGNPLG